MSALRTLAASALLHVASRARRVGGPLANAPAEAAAQALHAWPARGPARAVILALHGFGDAGDLTFEAAARDWAARGIAVYAPDQRGFGASPDRGRWPGDDALVADAMAMARSVRRRHPGLRLAVVGHSMGGGVALAAAADGMDADALVLAAPAITGGDALNPWRRAGARALAATLPDKRWTGRGLIDIRLTDNHEVLRRVAADPRHYGDASGRELYGLVRLMDRAAAAAPKVTTPTLVLIGAHDQVLVPDRIRAVAGRIPGLAGVVTYPGGWHWLFRDRQADRVWRDVGDFVLSGSPADIDRAVRMSTLDFKGINER